MPRPPKPSKKHHYVPQAQLKYFSRDPEQRSIWVFDKVTDRAWPSSLRDAGSENDFNTADLDTGRWNFEDLFQDVDDQSALLISAVVERRSIGWFGLRERRALTDLLATQILRTKFARTTPRYLIRHMQEMVRRVGYNPDTDPGMAMPTEATLRVGAVQSFLERDQILQSMERLVPVLFAAREGQHFVLSDDPVVVTNAFPYGDCGLQSLGVIVFLPLTPALGIALLCPTITARYEAIDQFEIDTEHRARMQRSRNGFRSGTPVEIEAEELEGWNERQVAGSARYVYAATDEFDFARKMLSKNPKLRQVETRITAGEMGHGLPARSGMPSGLQLVVHGRIDHCMLPVTEFQEADGGMNFKTTRLDLLNLVARDTGDLRTTLYEDGQPRREMSAVMIERFGETEDGQFRVLHRDASLQALMRRLDDDRKSRLSARPDPNP